MCSCKRQECVGTCDLVSEIIDRAQVIFVGAELKSRWKQRRSGAIGDLIYYSLDGSLHIRVNCGATWSY